jgi:hypothetical protein
MIKRNIVGLTDDERACLRRRIAAGASRPNARTHARILLKAEARRSTCNHRVSFLAA